MDDFNTPGSNTSWMDDGFKKYAAEWQLNNIEKLLDAKVERCRVYNSDNRDEIYNQITITYKEDTCKQ
ncbi:phosphoribosylformylglycinamidine synthase [Synechococcus phage ACG-2014j]|jgi:hypothetical protein|uniref:Phosphoribosylformylglycinamidine synthase n=1 Tax=Synechococcus phage ACG-2014j TaxID=1493514 RepID=A0A0E3FJU5_9CAUD|nr:phosphoribosylformylglycinamidine synthase [Synechococcus phage ACG-2014j]AIX28365.1 phosphoribosylformylglycinamidine synthase [Synechococcus phage ACG-2014j]